MTLKMNHLRLVQTLAEDGTLTSAGKRLHLSQSALSHQLSGLESNLGAPLFARVRKRMVLTHLGERVLKSAGVILDELDRLQHDTKLMVEGKSGILRLAATSHACFQWLPAVLGAFKQKHPGVSVEINSAATSDPAGHLLSGAIDLAIENIKVSAPQIRYEKLFDDEMFALVHKDHPWAGRTYVSARHFTDEHVVNYDHAIEDVVFYQRVLRPAGVTPKSWTKLPMTDAIVEMVRANMGVAVLGRWSIQPYLESDDLRTVKVTRRGLERTWYAATLERQQPATHVASFIELLARAGS